MKPPKIIWNQNFQSLRKACTSSGRKMFKFRETLPAMAISASPPLAPTSPSACMPPLSLCSVRRTPAQMLGKAFFLVLICEANSVDANVSETDAWEVSAKPSPPTRLPDPDNVRDVLAYWVRLKRVEKGWSQERLALECDLDRTYVSAVERSRWNVSLSNIERIAHALDVKTWTLIKPPEPLQ